MFLAQAPTLSRLAVFIMTITSRRESLFGIRSLSPSLMHVPLARLSRFDFVIPGEVPSDFACRPLLFVGIVLSAEGMAAEETNRPWVRGVAIIPLDSKNRPDFAGALCAPPICDLKP